MYFSCIYLIVLYVLVLVIFLILLVSGLSSVCYCGTPWTFLLTVLMSRGTICAPKPYSYRQLRDLHEALHFLPLTQLLPIKF